MFNLSSNRSLESFLPMSERQVHVRHCLTLSKDISFLEIVCEAEAPCTSYAPTMDYGCYDDVMTIDYMVEPCWTMLNHVELFEVWKQWYNLKPE